MIKKLKHITMICREMFELQGMSAVIDYVNQYMDKNPDSNIEFRQCKHCETLTPFWYDECLVCGQQTKPLSAEDVSVGKTIHRVAELRYLMEGLDDNDLICIETCDEEGDVEDLYPLALDVIENIQLTDGTIVREVRFCQRPNAEPDTRDKQRLVDALIDVLADDIAKGDTTVLDELLLRMPYDVLKYALPEDMWGDFENFKGE
jgi:hypothetical protein